MIRTKARSAIYIAAMLFGAGAAMVSCGRAPSSAHGDVGSVNVALTLSNNVIVNTVTYSITGNGIAPINGSIDVTNATHATALVPGIPANTAPYTVTMDATSTDGLTTCHGVGTFIVSANTTAMAGVTLQCHGPGGQTGTVAINGRLDNCPFINSFSASALEAQVGFSISVGVVATDFDATDVVTYAWSAAPAGVGTFANAAAANTTFTCATVGTTTLSIAVSDGVCGESRLNAIPVNCIARTGGIGGSIGTGGTGTGGAGTGGTGVGGMGVGGAGTGGAGVGGMGVGGAGTGGAVVGTGGMMMGCSELSTGTSACSQCTTDQCSLAPAPDGTDGCCALGSQADVDLCKAVVACYAANTATCTGAGDPTRCFCGTSPVTCFNTAGAANGPCVGAVQAAAKTTDPVAIRSQFLSASSPLGRATNLTLCRGGFCSAECGIQ